MYKLLPKLQEILEHNLISSINVELNDFILNMNIHEIGLSFNFSIDLEYEVLNRLWEEIVTYSADDINNLNLDFGSNGLTETCYLKYHTLMERYELYLASDDLQINFNLNYNNIIPEKLLYVLTKHKLKYITIEEILPNNLSIDTYLSILLPELQKIIGKFLSPRILVSIYKNTNYLDTIKLCIKIYNYNTYIIGGYFRYCKIMEFLNNISTNKYAKIVTRSDRMADQTSLTIIYRDNKAIITMTNSGTYTHGLEYKIEIQLDEDNTTNLIDSMKISI